MIYNLCILDNDAHHQAGESIYTHLARFQQHLRHHLIQVADQLKGGVVRQVLEGELTLQQHRLRQQSYYYQQG